MFYTYVQNNSGGWFLHDGKRGIARYVIIEADSAEEADNIAEQIGLYFDGAGDCPCCGHRWAQAYGGDDYPSIYEDDVSAAGYPGVERFLVSEEHEHAGYIHYRDGRIAPVEWGEG